MSHFSVRSLIIGITFAALAAVSPAARAQVLDPAAYTSDGALSLASGAYTLDTDALTFSGYSGVLSNGIAVFDFSSINVGANATVNVVGSHPLALLSQSDAIFGAGSSFNLNGGAGGGSDGNQAGTAGAAGGGGYAGDAGVPGVIGNPQYGAGPGGGYSSGGGGGGGGYGGAGGANGGKTYGNLPAKLEGGSGGGGGGGATVGSSGVTYFNGAGGGGGGGAIEINALGTLTLSGNLSVIGGNGGSKGGNGSQPGASGGGGAGGGVLMQGNRVILTASGQINAYGGSAGFNPNPYQFSGGGGGGRITIQTVDPNGFSSAAILNVAGGYTPVPFLGSPQPSGAGVITINGAVLANTPAPGSLLVAVLGAVPVVAALRKRRK